MLSRFQLNCKVCSKTAVLLIQKFKTQLWLTAVSNSVSKLFYMNSFTNKFIRQNTSQTRWLI